MTTRRWPVVAALGTAQTLAWASSYYLPAIVAGPMAVSFGCSPVWVFGAFSAGLLLAALIGPAAGRTIDRHGGTLVLASSSLFFALGLLLLATAQNLPMLGLGWAVLGLGMAAGLYDAAFATLAALYGHAARGPITGITLFAGFASTIGWPLSTLLLETWGWRGTCAAWAVLHLVLGLPLNALLVPRTPGVAPAAAAPAAVTRAPAAIKPSRTMLLLAFAFAATGAIGAALAAHLPTLLRLAGASTAAAIAAAAMVGPAQVAARLAELLLFRRQHPLHSGRLACALHPLGVLALAATGAPGIAVFAVAHGIGAGMLTIARGTLPLALFGPGGYGLRTALLSVPARLAQAASPLGFTWAIEAWGLQALWITAGLSLASLLALSLVRAAPPRP